MQTLQEFIDDTYPPYPVKTGNYKRREIPLASLLLTAQSWRAMGNTKWADYYQRRAKAERQRRRPATRPKAEGFDWRRALGITNAKPAATFPQITSQRAAAASTTMSH